MSILGTVLKGAFGPKRKAIVLSAASLLLALGSASLAPVNAKEAIAWTHEVDNGLSAAKQSSKYVLADVYTDWCGWCKRLDAQTFSDKSVAEYLGGKFVCIKVNAEDHGQGEALARKYQVDGFPCALVFDQSGKYIGRISGFMPPAEYQAKVQEILANPQ
jgi:thioredoxin-related protein